MATEYYEQDGGKTVLLASRSKSDGKGVFPRIPQASPSRHLYEDITLSDSGTLYSYTVMHPSPKTGKPPFVIGLVDFEEDTRVLGLIKIAPESVKIGMSVRVLESDTSDGAGYCFEANGGLSNEA